jgi:hypothetical protein
LGGCCFFTRAQALTVVNNAMRKLLQILVLLIAPVIGAAQNNKEEAQSFFKLIVKTYFDKDCDKFYSLFNDTVTIISPYGEEVLSSKGIDKDRKACDKFEEFTEGLASFQQYINDYKIIVLDKKEFTSKNNDSVAKKIAAEQTDNFLVYEIIQKLNKGYTDCDFLVFGNIHQSTSSKNISRGLFWLIVRKTKNGWKIFGTKA